MLSLIAPNDCFYFKVFQLSYESGSRNGISLEEIKDKVIGNRSIYHGYM